MNRDHKHLISLLLGVFLVTAIVALGIYETRDIIKGPGITVEYPTRGELIVNPLIEVQGKVKNASGVYLNGRKIFITEQGRFKEKLLLLPRSEERRVGKECRSRWPP